VAVVLGYSKTSEYACTLHVTVIQPNFGPSLLEKQGDAIAAHNKYRNLHQVPAIVWDDVAALNAQAWVMPLDLYILLGAPFTVLRADTTTYLAGAPFFMRVGTQ
jgi:hypothetical protein